MTDARDAARQAMGLWVMHAEPGSDIFGTDAPDFCWVPPGAGGQLITDSDAYSQWIAPGHPDRHPIVPNVSTLIESAQRHLQARYYRHRAWRYDQRADLAVDITRMDPADMALLMGCAQLYGVPTTLVERPPVGADRGVAIEVVVYPGPDAQPDVSGQVAAIVVGGLEALTNTIDLARQIRCR